jgi:4-hydroxybenzoate polyprenyltransferase
VAQNLKSQILNLKSFFRLIRFPNLVIMALTMILVKWCLIDTLLGFGGIVPAFSNLGFALLVISTVLVAAGGYVVNDYLDTDIDAVNKSDKIIVGNTISKKAAWNSYVALSLLGLLAAALPSWEIGNVNYVLIQVISGGLLWFYSYSYKRQILIGNLVVSGLSAIIVLLPFYYEAMAEDKLYNTISVNFFFVKAYFAFAFLTTFSRELIKDMEDMEGDKSANCRTFPIVAGIVPAKIMAIIFTLTVMVAVGYIQYLQYETQDYISMIYFLVAVQLPSLWLVIKTAKAKEKNDFHFASTLSKVVMVGGILSMLVFKYTL